jgi:hypothetical protein
LAGDLSTDDSDLIDRFTTEKVPRFTEDRKAKHCKKFQHLHKPQYPPLPPDNRKTGVNLSKVLMEEAACSALSKGVNYTVAPAVVPDEATLCGVEKAIGALFEESAEEVRQGTIRIPKGSQKPDDNLTVVERRTLLALKANEALTVLPTEKGSASVVLDTADYNLKIAALLEDQAYRKLKKDPTEAVECKTVLLLKKSSVSEEVCQQLQPQGSRPPRLYGLPKIHKHGVPLSPIASTISAPTYLLAKHLADLLGSNSGNSPHDMKNSTDFVRTLGSLHASPQDIIV